MARGKRNGSALHGKNIERRRDGDDWFYRFRVGGVGYYDTCSTTDKKKAEDFAAALKAEKKVEARRDRDAGIGPMRWRAARDNWWNDVGSKNVETGLEYRLDWLTGQIGESTLLRDIDPPMVTRIKNARAKCVRAAGKDAKGNQLYRPLTPGAVRATLVTLRSVINYNGKMLGAAVRMLDWPNWIERDDEEYDVRIMTDAEQALIWPELSDELRELADFNLETPKRINEILPLVWPNVDLPGEQLRLKLKGKRKLVFDPIGSLEVARLQRLKAARHHPQAVFTYISERTREYNGEKHVKGQRRPLTYSKFYEGWTAACARVGIADLNPHCLRHTGATRAYWATRDIYAVSKMLNHANIETTVKYYVRNDPSIVRDLKARISRGLHPGVTAKVTANLRVV